MTYFGTTATAIRCSLISMRRFCRAVTASEKTMPILMDKILNEHAGQAYETTRLRRNGVHSIRNRVFAEVLTKLEANGNAMRFVDTNGQIAWKATPQFRNYLMDLELDAEADLEEV
jgi:hypothetical protein